MLYIPYNLAIGQIRYRICCCERKTLEASLTCPYDPKAGMVCRFCTCLLDFEGVYMLFHLEEANEHGLNKNNTHQMGLQNEHTSSKAAFLTHQHIIQYEQVQEHSINICIQEVIRKTFDLFWFSHSNMSTKRAERAQRCQVGSDKMLRFTPTDLPFGGTWKMYLGSLGSCSKLCHFGPRKGIPEAANHGSTGCFHHLSQVDYEWIMFNSYVKFAELYLVKNQQQLGFPCIL